MRLSATQRVNDQYERRSSLKVKNQMFPVIIYAPTVSIFEKICLGMVLNHNPLDHWSNASPRSYLGMCIHLV